MNSKVSSTSSIKLLQTIGSPFEKQDKKIIYNNLYDLALKNKVSLIYLEALKSKNKLDKNLILFYKKELDNYNYFLKSIKRVSRLLNKNHIDYLIIKTIKPYKQVPGDIDLLIINDEDYKKAVEVLFREGYYSSVLEDEQSNVENLIEPTYGSKNGLGHISPTGTDLVDNKYKISIDIQKELALSHLVYLDKRNFKNIENVKIEDVETKLPSGELDLAIIIAHSVAEQMYLIGEFYSCIYLIFKMNKQDLIRFLDIINENKLKRSAKTFLTITADLYKNAFGELPSEIKFLLNNLGYDQRETSRFLKNMVLPYKYSSLSLIKIFFEKIKESRFRKTLLLQFIKTLNPKLLRLVIKYLIEMRKRESYNKKID